MVLGDKEDRLELKITSIPISYKNHISTSYVGKVSSSLEVRHLLPKCFHHTILVMDRGSDKDPEALPLINLTNNISLAVPENSDKISGTSFSDQKKLGNLTSSTYCDDLESSYFPEHEATTLAKQPRKLHRSTTKRMRVAGRRGWASLMASWSRKWNQAVKVRSGWARFVYGIGALLFLGIWIGIT
jgi:hypothetical protein